MRIQITRKRLKPKSSDVAMCSFLIMVKLIGNLNSYTAWTTNGRESICRNITVNSFLFSYLSSLKSLDINGFKSFSEKTIIDFSNEVNVIVGPNGSGKSNVVDAISWVLGTQSPATLRTNKMEDVIFAGTEKLSAKGFSEVYLKFATALNSNKCLRQIKFPYSRSRVRI